MAAKEHIRYIARLGDDAVVLGQRLSEWCGHGPILEEDIALTNLSLDCIGQARALYTHAGALEAQGRDEDHFAYFRDEEAFENHLMVELPRGDFGFTVMRQFLFAAFAYMRMEALSGQTTDPELAAIAAKSVKELRYHVEHARDWVLRLGDGTAESRERLQRSLQQLWPYTGELFTPDAVDEWAAAAGLAPDLSRLKARWDDVVTAALNEATLERPEDGWMQSGGKAGRHTEHLGYLLAEMQSLARKHPGVTW
jgi:ring-1,2-phenylacetyl-CoA epoxidase subunit PaaC